MANRSSGLGKLWYFTVWCSYAMLNSLGLIGANPPDIDVCDPIVFNGLKSWEKNQDRVNDFIRQYDTWATRCEVRLWPLT